MKKDIFRKMAEEAEMMNHEKKEQELTDSDCLYLKELEDSPGWGLILRMIEEYKERTIRTTFRIYHDTEKARIVHALEVGKTDGFEMIKDFIKNAKIKLARKKEKV